MNNDSLKHWRQKSKLEIEEILNDSTFPCIFGRKVNQNHTIKWLFCEASPKQKDCFLDGVREYTEFIKITLPEDRILSPLIVVLQQNDSLNLEEEHKIAWDFIQYLIDNDLKEWPIDIPRDTSHFNWCLCFNEVQLFVNISSSKHVKYKSRNLGSNICLVINPRQIFDLVAPLGKEKGLKIRNKIRERVELYNGLPAPEELGFLGDKNNLEWKQYQLYETGGLKLTECPLKLKNKE
jgi:FPC/CPF motif-containing protein YcgG